MNWRDCNGQDMQVELCLCKDDTMCQIFREKIANITSDDLCELPTNWTLHVENVKINAVTLPCRHMFHISGLVMHFASRVMQCPVCRGGFDAKLDLDCIPIEIRDIYKQKIESLSPESPGSTTSIVEINIGDIEREWMIIAQFRHNNIEMQIAAVSLIPTIIVPQEEVQNYVGMSGLSYAVTNFRVQNYFQRHLRLFAKKYRNDSNLEINFLLHHPDVDARIETRSLQIQEFDDYMTYGILPEEKKNFFISCTTD